MRGFKREEGIKQPELIFVRRLKYLKEEIGLWGTLVILMVRMEVKITSKWGVNFILKYENVFNVEEFGKTSLQSLISIQVYIYNA